MLQLSRCSVSEACAGVQKQSVGPRLVAHPGLYRHPARLVAWVAWPLHQYRRPHQPRIQCGGLRCPGQAHSTLEGSPRHQRVCNQMPLLLNITLVCVCVCVPSKILYTVWGCTQNTKNRWANVARLFKTKWRPNQNGGVLRVIRIYLDVRIRFRRRGLRFYVKFLPRACPWCYASQFLNSKEPILDFEQLFEQIGQNFEK